MKKKIIYLIANLLFLQFFYAQNLNSNSEAKNTFSLVEKNDSWINNFSSEDIQELPVGIKYTFGDKGSNMQAALGIINATVYSEYAEVTLFARVRLPQTDAKGKPYELFFGADKVKISHDGGIMGDVKLVLLGDINIPFTGNKWLINLRGGLDYKKGYIQGLTYLTVNCDGIKELGVSGTVEFSRDLILPIESNGEVDENKKEITISQTNELGTYKKSVSNRVKGEFQTVVSDWNDMLLEVSIQPFVLKEKRNKYNYDGNFQFYVNRAVLDLSDVRNSPSVKFPDYYYNNNLLIPSTNSWRGVYVETLEVRMPKEFMTTQTVKDKKRVAFGSHNLIIDNYGVSGDFYADNLIPLKEGITNKEKAWAYSVDHIGINLAANSLVGAEFNGKILLPVSKQEKDSSKVSLSYVGIISQKEYLISVKNDTIVDFSIWKAKGHLEPNSYVELKVKEGEFRPKAVLHGDLVIKELKENSNKEKISFEGIVFQNLQLQTEAPLFAVDYMGYKHIGDRKFMNFPITISEMGITTNKDEANLYFGIRINLMGDTQKSEFSGFTRLSILGEFEEYNRKQKWSFKGIEVGTIALKADMGALKLTGNLEIMENDRIYGDGFKSSLQATFGSFGPITSNAIFGSTSFRYWMVDAAIENLNLGVGAINLSGFAGGASYKMKRSVDNTTSLDSGLTYVPDENIGLGVKAAVALNIASKKAIQGSAGFEILFNNKGGVNQIGFYGSASAMNFDKYDYKLSKLKSNLHTLVKDKTGISKVENSKIVNQMVGNQKIKNLLDIAKNDYPNDDKSSSSIQIKFGMQQDFVNNTFHAELETYVNVAGMLTGRGSNHRAGLGVMHISPNEWYAYLGRPSDRLGIKLGVGPVSINTGGYLMIGDRLEESPPPPPMVSRILGTDTERLRYMRDENALSLGRGFAFGTDFSLDTGDMRFLAFYARFVAGGGFDIMLRDYGDAQCINTGKQAGINGWYANGQAYAYLQGELGIRIKLFFIKKKIPIIKAGAAALFQAKAPNPVWMRGYLGGQYNLLGGLIKGKFRFKITLGEDCEFAEKYPIGGIKMIADVSPDNNSETDVFAIPQATFAMKVGEELLIPEEDGDKTYKIFLDQFKVFNAGQEIEGKIEWSDYKDKVNFISKEILPPNTLLTAKVQVSFMEKKNGIFQPLIVDGKKAVEMEERTFTTGGAPEIIPLQNIQYSYPVIDQKYFFTDEYKQGYIQLKRGQSYLFDDKQWQSTLRLVDSEGNQLKTDFEYMVGDNRINYTLPKMKQSQTYQFLLVSNLKKSSKNANEKEVVYKQESMEDEENTVEIKQNQAESKSKEGEIERLSYKFSTSQYKTLKNKINSLTVTSYNWDKIYSDVIYLTNKIKDHENFDWVELTGSEYTENIPTLLAEAILEDEYYKKDIYPYLYQGYPLANKYFIKNRDTQELGVPPSKSLPIYSDYLTYIEYGINSEWTRSTFPYKYNLPYQYKLDWVDLLGQIVNDYVDGKLPENSSILNLMKADYKFIREGNYRIILKYRLPGGILGTQETINFKNRIKFN